MNLTETSVKNCFDTNTISRQNSSILQIAVSPGSQKAGTMCIWPWLFSTNLAYLDPRMIETLLECVLTENSYNFKNCSNL